VDSSAASVLDVLAASPRRARFVPEVAAALRRSGSSVADLETVLTRLEADGQVLIRDHYCADPHTQGTDLRVVALLDSPEQAIANIDRTWESWLADYFANHRCG
jgi:hypothetical protein